VRHDSIEQFHSIKARQEYRDPKIAQNGFSCAEANRNTLFSLPQASKKLF